MELKPGEKLGSYEIVSLLGKGGMGEVWKARDPQLGRDVAIKVSAQQFTNRFEREARAIAALNHPNVCTLYHIGPDYLVMEYIEGPTLAERIKEAQIPLEEALGIAKQIADALEAAHEKSIVHRDLKPANIKIRPDGSVKVLDFGLAKAGETQEVTPDSPTIMPGTQMGMILGTAGYMSPEQARGKVVDKRADIWAFGVVLYEMVTGKRLFEGETVSDTLAAVLKEEPDLTLAPETTRRLLSRCLEKDPKKRLRDIGDAMPLLVDEVVVPAASAASRPWIPWTAAGLVTVVATALAFVHFREKPPAAPDVRRYQIPMRESVLGVPFWEFALSPDGRNVAYIVRESSRVRRLYIHSLDSLEARAVPAAEVTDSLGGPVYPFWSPDSQYVAFVAGSKLRKVNLSSGSAQTICDVVRRLDTAGTWNRDGVILISAGGRISMVSAAGGSPSPVVGGAAGKRLQFFPWFLPDGRHFLYYGAPAEVAGGAIYIGSLDLKPDAQDSKPLLPADSTAMFAADPMQPADSGLGHLIFQREGALFSQPFDAKRGQTTGEAVPVSDEVGRFLHLPSYSVSTNGVLIYHSGVSYAGATTQLTWLDRQGHAAGTLGEPAAYSYSRVSPDGMRVAFAISELAKSTSDVWVSGAGRGPHTRVTFGSGQSQLFVVGLVWSPDSSRIVFSRRGGTLMRKNADGTGDEEPLPPLGQEGTPSSWSRDGRYILCTVQSAQSADIWVLPLDGASKPFPFLSTPAAEGGGMFSPDGRWVAYTSNETGATEVYVRPFPPSVQGKWLVSNGGLGTLAWRRDGKELYYMAPDRSVMAVPVTADSVFQHGEPKALFKLPPTATLADVMPDGNRFLVTLVTDTTQSSSPPFTVVLNWQAGLKK